MSTATSTAEQHEARIMLAFFAEAEDGEAVMDGAGIIWHKSGEFWYSGSRLRQVASADLARGLCPDLAEHMVTA